MAGIVFLKTGTRDRIVTFYQNVMGMTSWLEQEGISILRHENLLVGFVQSDTYEHRDDGSLVTFFYPGREDVDRVYARLKTHAEGSPRENQVYRIYNFYARDPEGRRFEVQTFLHELSSWQ